MISNKNRPGGVVFQEVVEKAKYALGIQSPSMIFLGKQKPRKYRPAHYRRTDTKKLKAWLVRLNYTPWLSWLILALILLYFVLGGAIAEKIVNGW